MDFSIELTNQRDFPSTVHRGVYAFARGITPLEYSLAVVTDCNMRESCTDYHNFIVDTLSDMYDNTEAYYLPVGQLEKFLCGKKLNGMKQKFPSKTKAMLSQERNTTHGYILLFYMLGKTGIMNGNSLIISDEDMELISKNVNTPTSPISLEKRLKALARMGFLRTDSGFVSTRYPNMFPAMCAFAKRAAKPSGFDFFLFSICEFRNIYKKHRPSWEDYFRPLATDQREMAYRLHDFAVKNKMKPVISTYWKVDYKYKGTQVMCIGSEGDRERLLDVRIVGAYNWENHALINDRLAKESPELQKLVLRHIWRCDACATSHLGMHIKVLGKRQRVCGGGQIGFRWRNPAADDFEALRKLIQLRCDFIDNLL